MAKKFDCRYCPWGRNETGHFCDDSNPAPGNIWVLMYNGREIEKRKTCPKPIIGADSRLFLTLFGHYERRMLPLAGGILNQPKIYADAMNIIAAARDEMRE